MALVLVEVELKWQGRRVEKVTTRFDPDDPEDLQKVLLDGVSRDRYADKRQVADYQIRVWKHDNKRHIIDYTGRNP
jgi:hypothetical protein